MTTVAKCAILAAVQGHAEGPQQLQSQRPNTAHFPISAEPVNTDQHYTGAAPQKCAGEIPVANTATTAQGHRAGGLVVYVTGSRPIPVGIPDE